MQRSPRAADLGVPLHELDRLVDDELSDEILARVWAPAIRRVRDHRAAGHRTVLITGAIRPLTRPLAPLFDEIAAAELAVVDGRCNGHLARPISAYRSTSSTDSSTTSCRTRSSRGYGHRRSGASATIAPLVIAPCSSPGRSVR